MERFEDGYMAGGDEGGHVRDGADLGAAAEDVTLTGVLVQGGTTPAATIGTANNS